jgi:hypothetical protein
MSKKISDDIFLTEEQLKARIRYHQYYEKHRTEINERRKQLYAANPEKYKERARKYYACLDPEQKKEYHESRKEARDAWNKKNRASICKKSSDYYKQNRKKCLEYRTKYYEMHAESLRNMKVENRRKKAVARKMCPAFRFTEYLRLKDNARFVTIYRPNTNLAHKASKVCTAVQCADYSLCPICNNTRISSEKMVAVCPMPHVFEFKDAIAEIRKFAKQIVAENQK